MEKIERLEKIITERAYENCGIKEDVLCAYGRSVRCNLNELDFSDQSTGLVKELHAFAEAGCQLVGFTKVQVSEYPEIGTNEFKMKPALKMQIL